MKGFKAILIRKFPALDDRLWEGSRFDIEWGLWEEIPLPHQ